MDEIEQTVVETILEVVQRRQPETTEIEGSQSLTKDLGLGSMDYAEIVAILELKLGVDPFATEISITSIHTVADLCSAYHRAQ